MAQPQPVHQIDVDELAREKVNEIEKLLDSRENPHAKSINSWLSVLKQIITAADLHRTNDKNNQLDNVKSRAEDDESIYADYADDNEQFNAIDLSEQFATNSVKWTIRVHAFKILHRLVHMFTIPTSNRILAIKLPIMRHLPDLVRLSFVAATSPYDDLKLQGLEMFKFLINRFASIEEREFPGHSILEQYRTQVLSALKPAFNLDAPPYITAIASQVCSLWICHGLERDAGNLRRTYQMMKASIDKLESQSINQNSKLYTESELERERLDILGSWAQLYISSKDLDSKYPLKNNIKATEQLFKIDSTLLNELVTPEIGPLIDKWWEALKDYALLIMPRSKIFCKSHDNDHVYTREVALRLFEPVWPKLILALTIWLDSQEPVTPNKHSKYFKFIMGILMKEFCACLSAENKTQGESVSEVTSLAIRSLQILTQSSEMKIIFQDELTMVQELYTTLYGILINCISVRSHHHSQLRDLLATLFKFVIKGVSKSQESIQFSITYLIDAIAEGLAAIETALQANETFEPAKTNLFIRVVNLISIVEMEPDLATSELNHRESLTRTFGNLIRFKHDLSLGVSILNYTKNFTTVLPIEFGLQFSESLFRVRSEVVSGLINSIYSNSSTESEKVSQLKIYLESHIKSLRLDINQAHVETQKSLMLIYIQTFVDALPINDDTDSSSKTSEGHSERRKELLELGIKCINEMRTTHPDNFETIMTAELSATVNSADEKLQSIKADIDSKQGVQVTTKPLKKSNPGRPPAKIVLKADFSNFYAKK